MLATAFQSTITGTEITKKVRVYKFRLILSVSSSKLCTRVLRTQNVVEESTRVENGGNAVLGAATQSCTISRMWYRLPFPIATPTTRRRYSQDTRIVTINITIIH